MAEVSAELLRRIERAEAILEIAQIHAKYVYYFDTDQYDKVTELFPDEMKAEYVPWFPNPATSKEELMNTIQMMTMGNVQRCHASTTPMVEFISDDKAVCHWYLSSPPGTNEMPDGNRMCTSGTGKYTNVYIKENGQWRMSQLRVEGQTSSMCTDKWVIL